MPTTGRFIASARLIAMLTFASRMLGVGREVVFSYFFSTSGVLSAFRIAFMVPNLARRLFGEGALSSAVIPVLTESLQERGEEASRRLVGTIFTALAAVLLVTVVLAELLIAGWRAYRDDMSLELAAVLMPYMLFICVVAIAAGVLNVRRHFAIPAAAPMLLNLFIIAAALLGAKVGGWSGVHLMYAVCGGVLLAGVAQVVLMGTALRVVGFFPKLGGTWRDPQLRSIAALMGPMVLGLSAVQLNSLADYAIAYLFIVDAGERVGPATLGYAQYLYQLPLGVAGISIATAIYPVLSEHAAAARRSDFADTLARGIRTSLFVALPATVGLIFVAEPLVATLFQRGKFDAIATQRVAGTLVFYALGTTAYFVQHLLVRAFYAMKDSARPARVALSMVLLNLLMNLSLVFVLQERGLALATSVCATLQVIWLAILLRRVVPEFQWSAQCGAIVRMIIATMVMAGVLYLVGNMSTFLSLDVPGGSASGSTPWPKLCCMVAGGVTSYALTAKLLGIAELNAILNRSRA